jgi:hypothetical protein
MVDLLIGSSKSGYCVVGLALRCLLSRLERVGWASTCTRLGLLFVFCEKKWLVGVGAGRISRHITGPRGNLCNRYLPTIVTKKKAPNFDSLT